ncbi:MAG: hypothetical protein SGI92_19905 [Bryobacteraceae bacterium]|nr:hypothetical protein [Bryobacteraceae bacterium]
MTYRVAFAKRFQTDGSESAIDPTAELDVYLADGIVADKRFVERFEPEAKHSQETLDEDDAFLGSAAAEVWEYEVLDARAPEFEDAIRNAQTVMEFEVIDETVTDTTDLSSGTPLADGGLVTASVGGLDDLTIVREDDPNLGLTNYGKRGPEDWAADSGPDREADRSTLAPDRR